MEPLIAIAFDLNFRHAAEIFTGVSDYVAEARLEWQLIPLNFGFEVRLMELAKSGRLAGAIGTFVSDGWINGLMSKQVAAVNMFNFSQVESIPNVGPDDSATGEAAAQHLIAQGATRFAFFGADGVHYTRLREAGFRTGLHGQSYAEIRPGPNLEQQVEQCRKGDGLLGVFCSNDLSAREFILAARLQGFRCGRDFLLVGVDNDPSESIFAGIGISSFKQPIRKTGYTAARALHGLLRDGAPAEDLQLQTPAKLIARESSLASGRARVAQQVLQYINERLDEPELEVDQIARGLGVSRRVLELSTKEQLGSSPYQLLAKARLKLAQQLLASTQLPIMEVGRRSGYPEPHHFSAWFKLRQGCAPKAFRSAKSGATGTE